ncbi:MAG: hypothetical protein RIA65_06105 [Woeseia sp.]
MPTSIDQAYEIQFASIAQWPDDVAGWKVARLPPHDRGKFPAERLAGPVFARTVREVEAGAKSVGQIYEGGFAAIEAEFILEIGMKIPPSDREWSDQDILEHIAAAYGGAEIASSPMPSAIELGCMAIIPDLGINTGIIVGPEIPEFESLSADALSIRVSVDGGVVGEARPGPIAGAPFEAIRFLIGHCGRHGIELPAGSLVSTGLLTAAHEVTVGSIARVDYGPFGWFEVEFEAAPRGKRR